jgi:FkbM family methyltransferase
MTYRTVIKNCFEKVTGLKIFRIYPLGINPVYDVKRILHNTDFSILFDIGANLGQSTKNFIEFFPNATIYSFEPANASFTELQKLFNKRDKVKCFNIALSNENGNLNFFINKKNPFSTMNSLLKEEKLDKSNDYEIQNVETQTLDFFCKNKNINHINYLKVDTEGNDLSVLKGAEKMLANSSIDIIQVEVGMNPTNKFHNSFDEVKQYLQEYKYFLFGIYDQSHEWVEQKPILRRCDALFISKKFHI